MSLVVLAILATLLQPAASTVEQPACDTTLELRSVGGGTTTCTAEANPNPSIGVGFMYYDSKCAEQVVTVTGCLADLPGCRICTTDQNAAPNDQLCPECICDLWQHEAPFAGCQYKPTTVIEHKIRQLPAQMQAEDAFAFNDTTPGSASFCASRCAHCATCCA